MQLFCLLRLRAQHHEKTSLTVACKPIEPGRLAARPAPQAELQAQAVEPPVRQAA
jgi:hypothetical protein